MKHYRPPLVVQCGVRYRQLHTPGDVQSRFGKDRAGKAQSFCTVMVAANGDDRYFALQHYFAEEIIQKLHRFDRRIAAVIDISRQ